MGLMSKLSIKSVCRFNYYLPNPVSPIERPGYVW